MHILLTKEAIARTRRVVRAHYRKHGRHDLPWRRTTDPYAILVSEIMLQQTQVARVEEKYRAFLKRFPTVHALANAPLRDVLVEWQGLGYNRRGKMLHEAAKYIVSQCGGQVPSQYPELLRLPGVGPYTASAICAFAFDQSVAMVETNIRTVVFHHFFPAQASVDDAEVMRVVTALCPKRNARTWYWALMDYGASLKASGVRRNQQSRHYVKQSRFEGSDRQVRGMILRALTQYPARSETALQRVLYGKAPDQVRAQLDALVREGLVLCRSGRYALAA